MGSRFLLLVVAAAAPAVSSPSEVTEDALLASLQKEHPALVAAAAVEEDARAESLRARLLPNVTVDYSAERPSGTTKQDDWGLSWALPVDGRYSARKRVAQEGEAVASARANELRLAARLRLRGGFAAWLRAHERASVLTAHAERLAALAGRGRARAEAGETTGLEARRLELEAAQARADLTAAEVEGETARAALAAWAALPAAASPVRSALPGPPPDFDVAARPSVRIREAAARMAEAEARLASRLPLSPEVRAGYQTQTLRDGAGTTYSGPVLSVALALPLFDRGQADRAQAAARQRAAEAELTLERGVAEAEGPAARAAFERLAAEAMSARAAAETAPRLENGALAAWTAGELPLTDLLDSLRSALGARLRDAETHAAALAAHAALEAAAGRPLAGEVR